MAQRAKGKHTARERLELLFDDGSFHEIEALRRHRSTAFGLDRNRPFTDGVVTGWGLVHGRRVFAYAHDFTIFGGSLGEAHAAKIHKVQDLALAAGCPIVAVNDGAGARIQEGITALAGYGGIFRRNVRASGVIPQVSVIVGPCAGGAAYSPALTDFVFVVRGLSHLFVTGPDVVRTVTGEDITHEDLGGADVHTSRSGVATGAYDSEEECFDDVRFLLSLLPSRHGRPPEPYEPDDDATRLTPELREIVPQDPARSYDVTEVVRSIVDSGEFFELHERWAPNLVVGLARVGGATVGIVANQPQHLAGVLNIPASEKGARFVQFCDAFDLPIVTLVDVPGFLPGSDQEHAGVIRHGAKLLYAYCNATVPRVQVVLRKAYGGAYIVMDSPSVGSDISFAWPANEIAVMGAEGAVDVLHRKRLAASPAPVSERQALIEEYREELMNPYVAAERGLVDEVIDPGLTRRRVVEALAVLRDKAQPPRLGKHGNPPQ
jgi:acetyl-CoA carboxylase carboxyltransferase component